MKLRRRSLVLMLGAAGGGIAGALRYGARALGPAAHAAHAELCFFAPPLPYEPASGLARDAARAVPAEARCPVCGMFPARRPEWAAQALFDNGDAQFLDSPASLVAYLARLERYAPGRRPHEVVASYVRPVDVPGWLPAVKARYVDAPGVLGPMRSANYLPFADAPQALARARAMGGRVLGLDELVGRLTGA